MTAIDFPNSPLLGETFSVNNRTWIWTGVTWDAVVTPVGVAIGGITGQVLTKSSNTNYQTTWADRVSSVVAGNGLVGGTITTTGTLSVDSNVVPLLNASQTFIGTQIINAPSANTETLVIKGGGGTASIFKVVSSSNSVVSTIDQTGNFTANSVTTNSFRVIYSGNVVANIDQTGNLTVKSITIPSNNAVIDQTGN